MPFGIILKDCEPINEKANFYVPSISLKNFHAPANISNVSHFFLKLLCHSLNELLQVISHSQFPPDITILLRLPQWTGLKELFHALSSVPQKTVVIVPIIEDTQFFSMLRDIFSLDVEGPGLILELQNNISKPTLCRYKCLKYIAIYLSSSEAILDYQIADLLKKSSSPALLLSQEVNASKPYEFWVSLSKQCVPSHSDMFIDPLQPLAVDMELDVYETFERDSTKYAQYEFAIEMALSDLSQAQDLLEILIIGPGRGPLLEMVMKYVRSCDKVVAVEKNVKCHLVLAELCEKWPENVNLVKGDVRCLSRAQIGKFDLVVSELLGSFGCNEAAPEILDIFRDFSPVIIPQEVRSYIQPIYTDLSTEACMNRPYLAKLNSYYAICEPIEMFRFGYPGKNDLTQEKTMVFNAEKSEISNALYGYFEADLYGPYRIGIFPKQGHLEYCKSWFPILFPVYPTKFPILLKFERKSESTVTYKWVVNGVSYGTGYNVDLA